MKKSIHFANAWLGIIIILLLSVFYYAFSRSSLQPSGHTKIYYIFSITGCLFFTFALLRFSAELKAKIALLTLSVIFSIYAIEIILSYSSNTGRIRQERASVADYLGLPFDSRSKYQVMVDMRDKGIDAYAFHNPTQYMYFEGKEIMALGFISNKTVIYCNESGEYIYYKSDEHGFNNPDGLYDQESPDFVLIGDSFTLGNCVKREEHFSGSLRKSGKKVLNLGMGNTGPLYQLAILKEYARPLRPVNVFWFFYEGNDHEGLTYEKKSSTLMKYLDKDFSQNLIPRQKIVDEMLIKYMENEIVSAKKYMTARAEKTDDINERNDAAGLDTSWSILKLSHLRNRLGLTGKCRCDVDPLFKDVFTEAKRTVGEWGGRLYFVYLPAWERYPEKANYCRKRFLNTGKKDVISIIKELQIPVIDIQSDFDSHPDPMSMFPFRIHSHYNTKGYKLVADHLDRFLAANREKAEGH